MERIHFTPAGLASLTLGALVAAAFYFHAHSTGASVCGDPTAPCWTQGKTVYQGISQTWGFGVLPNWVIPANAGVRFLNTGPNIPHLVVATNAQGGRVFSDPVVMLRTAAGPRLLTVRRLRTARSIRAWDLGPVPDGAVVWFQLQARKVRRYPAQAWEHLYANVTPSGQVNWAAPVYFDLAPLR